MTDNAVLLQDEYLEAAQELRDIAAAEKELAERKAHAKAIIEKILAVGEKGVSPDGEILVAVRAGAARFNPDKARDNLPAELLASVSVTTVDSKRAKAVLAPALYELCLDYNKPTVVAL